MEETVAMVEPRKADIQSIEAELAQLWRHISEAKKPGTGAVLRACLVNLIVVVQNQQDADKATQVIADITQDHPCRAIVLFADPGLQDDTVEAWVTAHCQLPNEQSEQVCCEQIFIHSSGFQSTGMVAPLLVSDLPVFVWWMGPLELDSPLSQRLQSLADRWVCDSANLGTTDPTYMHSLAHAGQPALSDINWSRLTPWREMVAQFFDAVPARAQLDELSHLVIESGDSWRAWLMLGWLGSRLGWTPPSLDRIDGDTHHLYVLMHEQEGTADRLEVTLRISPEMHQGLILVSLDTSDAQFEVERLGGDSVSTRATLPDQDVLERNVMMRPYSLSQYVCGELEILGHDKVFEQALQWMTEAMQHFRVP